MKKTVLATFLIPLLLGGMAFAAPIAQIVGGVTRVDISSEALQALESMDIDPSGLVPAKFDNRNATSIFPIPAGAIDQGNAKGDIFHGGGLTLKTSDRKVSLLNFIISTTGDSPVLTALVAVDDDILDRIPLFDLELPRSIEPDEQGLIVIPDVNLRLTQRAAEALNEAFGTAAFQENFSFGNADITALSLTKEKMDEEAVNGKPEEPMTPEPFDKEPAAMEPAGMIPAAEEPADEQPADEQPADEQPADEQPADEQPADEQPADEQPADEQPADEQPADEQPADEQPADEQPADEQPADEQPADEQPADEQPADEQPADEQPADEQPADEQPADEQPADEQPADEQPAVEQPLVE
ncbi:MAG: hypothetical protein R2940_12355 [Syntrophotaleaceae bacterium]